MVSGALGNNSYRFLCKGNELGIRKPLNSEYFIVVICRAIDICGHIIVQQGQQTDFFLDASVEVSHPVISLLALIRLIEFIANACPLCGVAEVKFVEGAGALVDRLIMMDGACVVLVPHEVLVDHSFY